MDISPIPGEALSAAREFIRAGRLGDAEQACAAVVRDEPGRSEAWALLGGLQLDRGAPSLAVVSLDKAVALAPRDPAPRLQLAVAQFRCGNMHAARLTLEELLASHPRDAVAAFHLGLLHERAGDDATAGNWFERALDVRPGYREASVRHGLLLQRQGRFAPALHALLQAWHPQAVELAEPIARCCLEAGDNMQALQFADIAIEHFPKRWPAWFVRGAALRMIGDPLLARDALRRASELAPGNALVLCELGCNARELGEFAAAQATLAAARSAAPEWQLPRWLHDLGLPTLPDSDAEAHEAVANHVAGVDALIADIEAGTPGVRETALDGLERSLPFALHYLPLDSRAATNAFGDLVGTVVGHATGGDMCRAPPWRALAHGGRTRVGFVSCELRTHTVMRYFSAWLTGLDRDVIEMHAWHLGNVRDEVSERIAAHAEAFHHVPRAPILDIAAQIRAARLDVLVYLEVGMDSRPQVLAALRLAPVQCAAYAHPVTTGLRTIDWFLSSDAMEPPHAQTHYRERLERLPGLGVVPIAPPARGDGSWLPREAGRPLLLCLQSLFKLVPQFDAMLARIVAATDAKVVFFESPRALAPRFVARLGKAFAAHRLDVGRHVQVIDRRSHAEYLGGIANADLVLDSIGFSGGATSLDALSTGTPVVTLEGGFMRGRQTAAMLRMLGADELIAHDADQYVEIAIAMCRDPARRDALRTRLSQHASRLFDDAAVVPALASFFLRVAREAALDRPCSMTVVDPPVPATMPGVAPA